MSGIQTIIDRCNGLSINRRRLVGIQYTRNEIARVSVTPTKNPWRFTLDMPSSFRYSEARDLIERIDRLDRITPQIITFSNQPKLSWIFKYRGTMNNSQISTITVQSFVGDQLTLTNLPVVPSTRVLFEPNDLIQIGAPGVNPYPFTVVNQVIRGSGASVTLTTHRPNIITTSVVGESIIVGNSCQFFMFCPNMPTYKLIVGASLLNGNGTLSNNAMIEWSDPFELYEQTATA